jgi:hypothetical protein
MPTAVVGRIRDPYGRGAYPGLPTTEPMNTGFRHCLSEKT